MLCKIVSVVILFVAIGMPSLFARDITTCYNGDEATPVGYMVNDECLTTEEIRAMNGVDCWAVFGYPSFEDSPWQGYFNGDSINCYVPLAAGYSLDTDYIFDESYGMAAVTSVCGGESESSYCPGGIILYDAIKANMGSTAAFSESCPLPADVYLDSGLTTSVSYNDIGTISGASSAEDCYLKSGTYYKSVGRFVVNGTCGYVED